MKKSTINAEQMTRDELASFLMNFGKKFSMGYILKKRHGQLSSTFDVDEIESLMCLAITKVVNRISGSIAQKRINEIKSNDIVTIEELEEIKNLQKTESINLAKEDDDFSLEKNVVGLFVRTFNREVNAYVEKNLRTYKRGYESYTASLASFDVDFYEERSSRAELSLVIDCNLENKTVDMSDSQELCEKLVSEISYVAPKKHIEKYQKFFEDVLYKNYSVKEALEVHKIGRNGQNGLYQTMSEVVKRLNLDYDDMIMLEECLVA